LGATAAEIAETLDVGAIMGGTVSMKSVRHAFAVMDEITGKDPRDEHRTVRLQGSAGEESFSQPRHRQCRRHPARLPRCGSTGMAATSASTRPRVGSRTRTCGAGRRWRWPSWIPRTTYPVPADQRPVASVTETGADAHIDALAKKYLGKDRYPYRKADEVRVTFTIALDASRSRARRGEGQGTASA